MRRGKCFSATTFLSAGNITHTPAYGHIIALGVLHAVGLRLEILPRRSSAAMLAQYGPR